MKTRWRPSSDKDDVIATGSLRWAARMAFLPMEKMVAPLAFAIWRRVPPLRERA